MKPSVGRVVHYVSYGTPGGEYPSCCRAAVVTDVQRHPDLEPGELLSLAVLNPEGMFFNKDVRYHEGGVPDHGRPDVRAYPGGTWHWPERVDESP